MAQATKKTPRKDSESTRAAKSAAAKAAATARTRTINRVVAARETRPLGGFMDFVREQGVVGLAIGLAIGTQAKTLVDQIVASFINPIVGLLLPGKGNLTEKFFSLTFNGKTEPFKYGALLSVMISFLAVCAVIYYVVKGLKLDKLDKKKDA